MSSIQKYKVLWIDDQHEGFEDFKQRAWVGYGINIEAYKYAKDGMKAFDDKINEWDGVIIDAKGFVESQDENWGLGSLTYCIIHMLEKRSTRYVPMFIFTGQPDLMDNKTFAQMLPNSKYYVKNTQNDELLQDIVTEADKLFETQLRKKYADVFTCWSELDADLLKITSAIERNETKDVNIGNVCRQTLEKIIERMVQAGLVDNSSEVKIGPRCESVAQLGEPLVPAYVSQSLYVVARISNSLSHNKTVENTNQTTKDVKAGKANYVIPMLCNATLTLLVWADTLRTDDRSREAMRGKVAKKIAERSNDDSKPYTSEREYKDEYGSNKRRSRGFKK